MKIWEWVKDKKNKEYGRVFKVVNTSFDELFGDCHGPITDSCTTNKLNENKIDNVILIEECNVRWEGPWNDAKDDAEVYCGDCDYNLDYGAEDWNFCPMCGLKLVYRDEFAYKNDLIEKEK